MQALERVANTALGFSNTRGHPSHMWCTPSLPALLQPMDPPPLLHPCRPSLCPSMAGSLTPPGPPGEMEWALRMRGMAVRCLSGGGWRHQGDRGTREGGRGRGHIRSSRLHQQRLWLDSGFWRRPLRCTHGRRLRDVRLSVPYAPLKPCLLCAAHLQPVCSAYSVCLLTLQAVYSRHSFF